jgi:hypothetical protein
MGCFGLEIGHFLPAIPTKPVDALMLNVTKHGMRATRAISHNLGFPAMR